MELGVEKYNVNDFVKDKFTQDEIKYLPIKYDDTYEKVTVEDIKREFEARGLKIESISSNKITNGTQIKTANATYVVVIYGDANGDGEVDIFDARQIVEWLLYEKEKSIPEITRIAANVNKEKEDVIDIFDARRIVEFVLGTKSIIDTTPESDISKDKEAPIITLNGDKEVSIKVFGEYKDLGATVKDNLDETIGNKIVVDTSKVNTKVPGDYEVTYNATDASGNKAETVKRIVHVEDYAIDIAIETYPKVQYVVGQDITIDNMVAYEILAYGGKSTKPINVKDIKYTPKKATADMVGTSEITIEYKGVTKKITIEVQERVPIITLTGHNGSTDVKIRLGENYVEGATAFDELDQQQLKVTIEGTVDKNVEGIYTITYTSEPNSLGKVGKVVRTVEVCDYVTDVDFIVDDTKFKKDYIEGESISLEGVSAVLTKASKKTETVTTGLKLKETKAIYDRNTERNNTDRELEVTYTVIDPVDGTSKEYKSTEKLSDIKINVKKQFETIKVIGNETTEGQIFEDNIIATVQQGANEDTISIDKLDIKVTPVEKDEHGCETKAWAEVSSTQTGALDIHFRGIAHKTYTITLTPKTESEHKQAKTFTFTTLGSEEINSVSMTGIKKSDGTELEKLGVNTKNFGLKVGEKAVIELKLFHNYVYNGETHEVELSNIPKDKINIQVQDIDSNLVSGNGGWIDAKVVTDGDKLKIEVYAKDNAPQEDDGKRITIKATVQDTASSSSVAPSMTLTTYIFAKSRYEVILKKDGEADRNDITLSLRDTNSADGYTLKKIGNDIYTILPITIKDQYDSGNKKISKTDISTNHSDIAAKKIVFDDGLSTANDSNYIKTIALKTPTEVASDTDEVKYVGIAIRDLQNVENEEDKLEKATMKVYFDGKEVKTYNSITILRKEIANLKYVNNSESNAYTRTGYCYDDIAVAIVSAGDRQEALKSTNLKDIGCTVTKDGVSVKLINSKGTTPGLDDEIKADSASGDFGIREVIDDKGNVRITFWSRTAGAYTISPYIMIDGQEKELAGNTIKVNENTKVNKIAIVGEDGKELTAAKVNDDGTKIEGDFGTIDYGKGVSTTREIKFYHEYEKSVAKVGTVQSKPLTNVIRSDVDANITKGANNQITDIGFFISDKGTEFYSEADSTLVAVDKNFGDSVANCLVTKLDIALVEKAQSTGTTKFSIIVGGNTYNFSGRVGDELVVDHVTIGTNEQRGSEGIKIYTKTKDESAEVNAAVARGDVVIEKTENSDSGIEQDVYYTVVPVTYFSGTREIGPNIKANQIGDLPTNIICITDSVIDELGTNAVQIIGLTKDKKKAESTDDVYYIGLGIFRDNKDYFFGTDTSLITSKLTNCTMKCTFKYNNNSQTFDETFNFTIKSDYNG